MILAAHALLADTVNPVFALTKDEASSLAEATNKVLRHYDIKMTQKALDHYALLMTAGGIYGPRLAVVLLSKKAQPKPAPATAPLSGNVMQMKPAVTNGSGLPIA